MAYKVTKIELDFLEDIDGEPIDEEYREAVYEDILDKTWDVADEQELNEEIESTFGWAVSSIRFKKV